MSPSLSTMGIKLAVAPEFGSCTDAFAFVCGCCLRSPSVLSTKCYAGNASSCLLQPVDDFSACFSCDGGRSAEAGNCWIQAPAPYTAMCADVRPQCEADGGVFSWCYGDACNSCTPRYQPLPHRHLSQQERRVRYCAPRRLGGFGGRHGGRACQAGGLVTTIFPFVFLTG